MRLDRFWTWLFSGLFCIALGIGLGYPLLSGEGVSSPFARGSGALLLILVGGWCIHRALQNFSGYNKE